MGNIKKWSRLLATLPLCHAHLSCDSATWGSLQTRQPHHEYRCVVRTAQRCLEASGNASSNLTKIGCDIVAETHCRAHPHLPEFAPSVDLVKTAFRWEPPVGCKDTFDNCTQQINIPYFNLPICGQRLPQLCKDRLDDDEEIDEVLHAVDIVNTNFSQSLKYAYMHLPAFKLMQFQVCLEEADNKYPEDEGAGAEEFFACIDQVKNHHNATFGSHLVQTSSNRYVAKITAGNESVNATVMSKRKDFVRPQDYYPPDTVDPPPLEFTPPYICIPPYNRCMTKLKNPNYKLPLCLSYIDKICVDELRKSKSKNLQSFYNVQRLSHSAKRKWELLLDVGRHLRPVCSMAWDGCISLPEGDFFKCLDQVRDLCKNEKVQKNVQPKDKDGHILLGDDVTNPFAQAED